MSALRGYFAPREDPYAGGDLANASRLGTIIWGLLVLLVVLLLPLSPPDDAIGGAGWAVAVALILAGVAAVFLLAGAGTMTWEGFLVLAYLTVAGLGLMQWLCGGQTAPFRGILLLPVLFVAATQPPRRIAPFMGVVLLVLITPFLYDGWDGARAQATGATFVVWCALAVGAASLMGSVRSQRLAHAAQEAEARAEARVDSLTGLHNRRAFDELLRGEVERARRFDLPLSVAMVDIENFKEVNDRWSYADGDRCLRDAAQALRSSLRQPDFCFRWGGDEFAFILSGTPAEETDSIGDRLRSEVARTCRRPDGSVLRIRFAVAELHDGMTAAQLSALAGLALTGANIGAAR